MDVCSVLADSKDSLTARKYWNKLKQRIKSIEVRKELTDEWKRTGVQEGLEYASLTDIITHEWSGFTTKQYKNYKDLKKENLQDNMTNLEIALNILAEASATELSKQRDPKGFEGQKQVAKDGGSVAKVAREQLEDQFPPTSITSLLSTRKSPFQSQQSRDTRLPRRRNPPKEMSAKQKV